jgi:hypothetical protein
LFDIDHESCRARDEACDLRNQLCRLNCRLEEVEDERKFNAAKANELKDAVKAFKSGHAHDELVKKSLRLAEMAMEVDSLHLQLKRLEEENAMLLHARRTDQKKMEELSLVIRTIQCSDDDDSVDDQGEILLTPERALDKTLRNMKAQVEFLEDEHQSLAIKCAAQQKTISMLKEENEMKDTQIKMLEELFRSLNEVRHDQASTPTKKDETSVPTQRRQEPTVLDELPQSPKETTALDRRQECKKHGSLFGRLGSRWDHGHVMTPARLTSPSALKENEHSEVSSCKRGTTITVGDEVGEYIGHVVDGQPDGVGTVRFPNGKTYLGEVKNGKLHGRGTLYCKSGVSRGRFQDNVFVG